MKIKTFITSIAIASSLTAWGAAPHYIFYFIGDGMGNGHVMSTETFNRDVLGNTDKLTMMQFPVAGQAMTYSASSTVTDSAAAGTALSTGTKTRNGMLGMNPDTMAVTSIAKHLHDNGYGVGLVTSVAPDDATPGAFYAHVPSRSMYYEIGRQAAASGYEFIAGSQWRGVTDKKTGEATDLYDIFRENGIDMVSTAADAANSDSRRVFLFDNNSFHSGNIGYTIDSIPNALTLPDMTGACITHLLKNTPDKFFMMVEGGNIDHAGHANDGATVIIETLNFDKALKLAYDFYLAHPDETLIIVTADHDTGGLALGNKTTGYASYLKYVPYQKISKEMLSRFCKELLASDSGKSFSWDNMKEYLSENMGLWDVINVKPEQEERMKKLFDETFELRNSEDHKSLYASFNAFAVAVFDVWNNNAGIGWASPHHTGNPVPVYAVGEGAEIFSSLNNNIDIPAKILKLAGITPAN